MHIKVKAPGKLILSGEHAVAYGAPALALAVNRHAYTTITNTSLPRILFELVDLAYRKTRNSSYLHTLKHRLERDYQAFLAGKISIRSVLKEPFELLEYSATHFLDDLPAHLQGLAIHIHSNIPMGCGMGSSAACIVSLNFALQKALNKILSAEEFYALNLNQENLQHGRSSGVDIFLATHGGCWFLQGLERQSRPLPSLSFQVVNTGKPMSTTGECVSAAKAFFNDRLLADFAKVTKSFDQALQKNDLAACTAMITENHRLLCQIGVVPLKVQAFIQELEQLGLSAKICGAGSIRGDASGMMIVFGGDIPSAILQRYRFQLEDVNFEPQGVQLIA